MRHVFALFTKIPIFIYINNIKMKKCNKCIEIKELTDFHKDNANKDGHKNICKVCSLITYRKYLETNGDKVKESVKRYINSDKGKKTRSKVRRNYYIENKTTENKRSNEWNKNHKKEIKEYNIEYSKGRRIKDKHQIMWRTLLHNSLKRMGKTKENHTIDLLGYSITQLKEHLESLFTDGMSWDNYGEWHIDHVKTVNSFDNDTPISIVNALSNLRPLWATTREINGIIYEGNLNRNKY